MGFQELVAVRNEKDRIGYPMDGWTEGPGLPQSVWRYKWLVGVLVLLGILGGLVWSTAQPTRFEGVVRIFVTADEGPAADPERTVVSHAQFIESPVVLDRVISLTGNRLTRKELEKQLKVEPSTGGDFITIHARDATPADAAGLADAVDVAYRQILTEQRQAAANQTIEVLEGEQRRLASELTQIQSQRRTRDDPSVQAAEQAKRRQMEATADKIEEVSAGTAGPPPALQDKAAVPDEPVQPKPLLASAIGALLGLVIGIAAAWLMAARQRVSPGQVLPPVAAPDVAATDSEIHHLPGQVRPLANAGAQPVASVGEAVNINSLDKDPDLLYSLAEWLESQHQNFPQVTAERLRDRLLFDRVAVLLKTDEGLNLAGCVGWRPDGVRPFGQHDPSILSKLGANGARQIESGERDVLLNAGLLGDDDQTIVVAPLKHENVAFGVLLVGNEQLGSKARPSGNGGFDPIGLFARSVAPDLHAWLLLHKLREQLASHTNAKEQITSRVEPKSPSAQPSTERPYEQISADAKLSEEPPATESPSAGLPFPESEPPSAESQSAAADPTSAQRSSAHPKSKPAAADPTPAQSSSAHPKSKPAAADPTPAQSSSAYPKSRPAAADPTSAQSSSAHPNSKPAAGDPTPPEFEPTSMESPSAETASGDSAYAESESLSAWPVYPAGSEPLSVESEAPSAESEPPSTRRRRAASSVRGRTRTR